MHMHYSAWNKMADRHPDKPLQIQSKLKGNKSIGGSVHSFAHH